MNLDLLCRLAERVKGATPLDRVVFAIFDDDSDEPVLTGFYNASNDGERRKFAQAVGKLLAAGYEVCTWRMDEEFARVH